MFDGKARERVASIYEYDNRVNANTCLSNQKSVCTSSTAVVTGSPTVPLDEKHYDKEC